MFAYVQHKHRGRGLLGAGGGKTARGREGAGGRVVVHFMYDVETVKAKKKARGRAGL